MTTDGLKEMRAKIAAAKLAAREAAPEAEADVGPARGVILGAFAFVAVLAGLALYFIHALTSAPAPILPPH
jgi:hypothetical protein